MFRFSLERPVFVVLTFRFVPEDYKTFPLSVSRRISPCYLATKFHQTFVEEN